MSKPRVVIVGTEPAYFGTYEWARHLFPMKTFDQALALRGRILDTYEVTGNPTRRPFRYRDLDTMATAGPVSRGRHLRPRGFWRHGPGTLDPRKD